MEQWRALNTIASTRMSTKPAVLVSRRIFPEVVDRLRSQLEVETNDTDEPWSQDELIRRLRGKAGIFVTGTERIDAKLLDACPSLRAVCSMAVGYNNIDVPACTAHGVLVSTSGALLTRTPCAVQAGTSMLL